MKRRFIQRPVIAAAALGAILLAACGDDAKSSDTTAKADQTAAECAAGKTVTDGTLTIATGEPAFPPYIINDATPEDGQGFESAVAMAVATELGFDVAHVKWIRTGFDEAIAPGPKDFDFNLQQFGITPERAAVVTFSQGYYTSSQAIFGLADSPAADAKTLADLKGLKIGVAAGTTSLTYVEDVIQPDSQPFIFNDNAAAKQALEDDQIDAIVSDLPTALYITAVEIEGTTVFGQIEGSGTDQFGLLMSKDNPIATCVDLALTALKDSGELDQITTTWMSDYLNAPVISLG